MTDVRLLDEALPTSQVFRRPSTLSSIITFDETEYVIFLESIEDNLVELINRGPNV